MKRETTFSVSQVNSYIHRIFEGDYALKRIKIHGEVSNCKYHSSGHIYFTLKDEKSALRCIMFSSDRSGGLDFQLENGQSVVAEGNITVFVRDGAYQLYCGAEGLNEYSWFVENAGFRPIKPYTDVHDYVLKEGAILRRYDISWEPLFDRLPFTDKRDNIWRLSVCRWAPGGGQTWGGPVHQPAQAGYIRFPDFTPEQRTAIMETLLRKAWSSFRVRAGKRDMISSTDGWGKPQIRTEKYFLEETAEAPRSYVNYNEDPGFRPILDKLQAERYALAPAIGAFASLPPDEQAAFYE